MLLEPSRYWARAWRIENLKQTSSKMFLNQLSCSSSSEFVTSRENKCCQILISDALGFNFASREWAWTCLRFHSMLWANADAKTPGISIGYLSIYPIRPESFCFTWSNHKIETCTISSSELGIRLGSALRESCVLVEGLRPNPLGSGRSGAAEKISIMQGTYGWNQVGLITDQVDLHPLLWLIFPTQVIGVNPNLALFSTMFLMILLLGTLGLCIFFYWDLLSNKQWIPTK
jgi:hypothetical protein